MKNNREKNDAFDSHHYSTEQGSYSTKKKVQDIFANDDGCYQYSSISFDDSIHIAGRQETFRYGKFSKWHQN